MQLPPPTYLTAKLPGTGGLIKQHLDDFRVEELAAYKFEGVGTHCYLKVEKRGFSTMAAADILAKALGRKKTKNRASPPRPPPPPPPNAPRKKTTEIG